MNSKPVFKIFSSFLSFAMVLTMLSMAGCNGSSTSSSATPRSSGSVYVGLTDAPGDFVSYTVNVTSISLTRANGVAVNTLPVTDTAVDFTQYAGLTEFLTAATVPSGVYTQVQMTIDYTNEEIYVVDPDGNTVQVPPSNIYDESGDPVTTLTVTLAFDNANPLVVAPGLPANLTLDFNLADSNQVTFNTDGTPELVVSPTLQADINPATPKLHRLRGPLKSVSVENNTFSVMICPFRQAINRNAQFGTMPVNVTDQTVYDINQTTYKGSDGLQALSQIPLYTGVVVTGEWQSATRTFTATEVRVGTSITGDSLDAVTGNVLSISGNTLVIKGASVIRETGTVTFRDTVTVEVGDKTVVRQEFSTTETDISALAVGERLTVFGTITDSSDTATVLDATSGYAVIHISTISGTVVSTDTISATPIRLVINLQRIDNHPVGIFDFSSEDIDPAQFAVSTGGLDLSGLTTGTPVKLLGFFTPAGPGAFAVQTIINVTNLKGNLKVNWQPATSTAFSSISGSGLTLDLTGAGFFHYFSRGWTVIDLTQLSTPPVITGTDGTFWICRNRTSSLQVFTTFNDFSIALAQQIANGAAVQQLSACGSFNESTATLTADRIGIRLSTP